MNRKRVICAGNGLAALNLAAHIDEDTEVWIIATDGFVTSNSFKAKGGIAIPTGKEDTLHHITDTLVAGDGLCNPEAVEDIIGSGVALFDSIEKDGLKFDKTISREGGHSSNRVRHIGDETGKYLTTFIASKAKKRANVKIIYNYCLLDLWMEEGMCKGVQVGNIHDNTIQRIAADVVVLATGGCGNLYRYHSNSLHANGEGYAIAHRAGAALTGMEFIQFHPTLLWTGNLATNFLVTEAFRGAGAVLKDLAMKELMKGVHAMESLAPRDIVSLTLFQYMKQHKAPHVWLDFSQVDTALFQKDFPALYQVCEKYGFLSPALIPVVPAAHYMCGGVKTDLYGQTTISNLYAIGEVASTGLHGANRLASNSLLELMVLSERTAKKINESKGEAKRETICYESSKIDLFSRLLKIQSDLQSIMWNNFGISRNEGEMKEGIERLQVLKQELVSLQEGLPVSIHLKQLQNRIQTGLLIAHSALERKESRGCHFREDDPARAGKDQLAVQMPS